jgi:mono/diheme cytochrome c family protein
MRTHHFALVVGLALLMLDACAGPATLPTPNATPIPTLAPITELQSLAISTSIPASGSLTLPTQMPSSRAGQVLYVAECAKCHADDGKGAVSGARDFTDVDFVRGESPATFFAVVSEGRGEMPAFKDKFSPDDRWNMVFYVWRFSTTERALAQGKELFVTNCAACHGPNGTGAVLGAADFTNISLMANSAPRDFYKIITQGKGSMPSWQGRLSQDERWAAIDFIRTFSYDPSIGDEAPATQAVPASP